VGWHAELDRCWSYGTSVVKEKILEGVNKFVPSSLPFSSWKKPKWKRPINVNTRENIKQKSKLWRRYIQSRDPKILLSYKKKFVILSETKQDRQIDLLKMK